MKDQAFIDSDIILDLLAQRQPHQVYAEKLFSLIDQGQIHGFVTPIIFANLYYIVRKLKSTTEALEILKDLRPILNILPVNQDIVDKALHSGFSDFEDALQYHAAIAGGLGIFVTRNQKDFKKAKMTICNAKEYLELLKL